MQSETEIQLESIPLLLQYGILEKLVTYIMWPEIIKGAIGVHPLSMKGVQQAYIFNRAFHRNTVWTDHTIRVHVNVCATYVAHFNWSCLVVTNHVGLLPDLPRCRHGSDSGEAIPLNRISRVFAPQILFRIRKSVSQSHNYHTQGCQVRECSYIVGSRGASQLGGTF